MDWLLIILLYGGVIGVLAIVPAGIIFCTVWFMALREPSKIRAATAMKWCVGLTPVWIILPGFAALAVSGLIAPHGGPDIQEPSQIAVILGVFVTIVSAIAFGIFLRSAVGWLPPILGLVATILCLVPASGNYAAAKKAVGDSGREILYDNSTEWIATVFSPFVWSAVTASASLVVWSRIRQERKLCDRCAFSKVPLKAGALCPNCGQVPPEHTTLRLDSE